MKRSTAISLILLLQLASIGLKAQWTHTNGPYSADVTGIAIKGSMIFAATDGAGVYRSIDSGGHWAPMNNGLSHADVFSIASGAGQLYAGTLQGVSISTDDGESWQRSTRGLPQQCIVNAIATNGAVCFAATEGSGFYRSIDHGATWVRSDSGMTHLIVHAILFRDSEAFVGTGGGGAFRSEDDGRTWKPCSAGVSNWFIHCIASMRGSMYAATDMPPGVYQSLDTAQSWIPSQRGLNDGNVRLVTAITGLGGKLVVATNAGAYFSNDSGTTWSRSDLRSDYINVITPMGAILFAGGELGVYRSDDSGRHWTVVNNGLGYTSVNALTSIGNKLFAGTYYGGLYSSTNDGAAWTFVGLKYTDITALLAAGDQIYAGTDSKGIYGSSDSGVTWNGIANLDLDVTVHCIDVIGNNILAGTNQGCLRLTSGGSVWRTAVGFPALSSVLSFLVLDSLVYAGTSSGIYASHDSGRSWSPTNFMDAYVFALAARHSTLYAGSYFYGVFSSTDGGSTWNPSNVGLGSANTYAFASVGSAIFAGTDSGVFLTLNDRSDWTVSDLGLTDPDVQALGVFGSNIYAGTYFGGVWRHPLAEGESVPQLRSVASLRGFSIYPNPASHDVTIRCDQPSTSDVSMSVIDEWGRVLMRSRKDRGDLSALSSFSFDATTLPNGVYFCRAIIGNEVKTEKFVVLH